MRPGSLRLRLFVAAAISIAIALVPTGFAMMQLFENQVRDRVVLSLRNDLLQLAGTLDVDEDSRITIDPLFADPRYGTPYGLDPPNHRYWQVTASVKGGEPVLLRSASLWDFKLDPKVPAGPNGEPLIMAQENVQVMRRGQLETVSLLAAAGEAEMQESLGELRRQLFLAFAVIGAVMSAGTWLQVTVGLSPLRQLRSGLAAIRQGTAQRLSGGFPAEVAPLVAEFNDVLNLRDVSLERARRRAGDLAHGLKTPLTVLSAISRQLRKAGLAEAARDIDDQSDTMLRHVERALVRARLSSGKGFAASELASAIGSVVAALSRLPGAEELRFEIDVPADSRVPIEQRDLTELLGNLIDNARKWAKATVRVRHVHQLIIIEDDGPGVPDTELGRLGERGRRLDEAKQGSGLGLSIVEDIADIYGLAVTYGRSELGGLRVAIRV